MQIGVLFYHFLYIAILAVVMDCVTGCVTDERKNIKTKPSLLPTAIRHLFVTKSVSQIMFSVVVLKN